MNKKAFTIVELAVVLVVIGIILGMVVKGKTLVKSAKIRSEIAKIYKFEAAFNVYYAKNNHFPPATIRSGAASINMDAIFNMGLLTNEDINAEYLSPNYRWGFSIFSLVDNGPTPGRKVWHHHIDGNSIVGQVVTKDSGQGVGYKADLVCWLEHFMDDGSAFGGQGRMAVEGSGSQSPAQGSGLRPSNGNISESMDVVARPINYYGDCAEIPSTHPTMRSYGYRVF